MKKDVYLFIMCGQAFSGKSTLAKEIAKRYEAKIIGRDAIYFAVEKLLALEETPEEDDSVIWDGLWPIAVQGAKNQLMLWNSVVFDDNCLYFKQREELSKLAESLKVKRILIYLDVPNDILEKRKEENKTTNERHDVPSSWLKEDSELFEKPTENEDVVVFTDKDEIENLFKKIDK